MSRAQRRSEARLLAGAEQALTSVARPWPTTVLWRWRYELMLVLAAAIAGRIAAEGTWQAAAVLVGVLAMSGLGAVRRAASALAWRVVTAHRVRSGCAQARIHSRQGRLPAVLRTRSTPSGERVLLWCPAGVSGEDFASARAMLAAACWAREVRINVDPHRTHLVELEVVRGGEGSTATRALVARARRHAPLEADPAA